MVEGFKEDEKGKRRASANSIRLLRDHLLLKVTHENGN